MNIFANKDSIVVPILFLISIWGVYTLQYFGIITDCYGLQPKEFVGLRGVFYSPLLHGSWEHLISNSPPILFLLFLLFQVFEKNGYFIFILGWLLSGFLTWIIISLQTDINSGSCHIGASGLVYFLASFLFFNGIFNLEKRLIAISLVVAFVYGSLIWGVFPQTLFSNDPEAARISWQGHLAGALAGIVLSLFFKNAHKLQVIAFKKAKSASMSAQDKALWEAYLSIEEEKQNIIDHYFPEGLDPLPKKRDWKDFL